MNTMKFVDNYVECCECNWKFKWATRQQYGVGSFYTKEIVVDKDYLVKRC